jgi:hypothetical protein
MSGSIHRPVRVPGRDFDEREIPVLEASVSFLRVHETGRTPLYFSRNAAHRYSHPDGPLAVCYVAETVETCLWERFGDDVLSEGAPVSRSVWMSRSVTWGTVEVLRICDLTQAVVRSACRVDLSALHHTDLSIPQAWSKALQEHPAQFEGLRYLSRFDQGVCLALFGRSGIESRISLRRTEALGALEEGDSFLNSHRVALV